MPVLHRSTCGILRHSQEEEDESSESSEDESPRSRVAFLTRRSAARWVGSSRPRATTPEPRRPGLMSEPQVFRRLPSASTSTSVLGFDERRVMRVGGSVVAGVRAEPLPAGARRPTAAAFAVADDDSDSSSVSAEPCQRPLACEAWQPT